MHQSFETLAPPPLGIPEVNQGQSLGFSPFSSSLVTREGTCFHNPGQHIGEFTGLSQGINIVESIY